MTIRSPRPPPCACSRAALGGGQQQGRAAAKRAAGRMTRSAVSIAAAVAVVERFCSFARSAAADPPQIRGV
jgi:hypothetical protein